MASTNKIEDDSEACEVKIGKFQIIVYPLLP